MIDNLNNSTNVNRRRERIIRYAPLILWIGVIFYMSSNAGAMSETSRFVRPILEFLFPAASEETLRIYHGYVRKSAHFTEYALLAILAARALTGSSIRMLKMNWAVAAFLIVGFIAVIDETGQSLRISRTGSIWDVALDVLGGTAAVIAFKLFFRRNRISSSR